MTNEEFIAVAKAKVFENYRDRIINNFAAFPDSPKVFVAWYTKILQNHKALLGVSDELTPFIIIKCSLCLWLYI